MTALSYLLAVAVGFGIAAWWSDRADEKEDRALRCAEPISHLRLVDALFDVEQEGL